MKLSSVVILTVCCILLASNTSALYYTSQSFSQVTPSFSATPYASFNQLAPLSDMPSRQTTLSPFSRSFTRTLRALPLSGEKVLSLSEMRDSPPSHWRHKEVFNLATYPEESSTALYYYAPRKHQDGYFDWRF